MSGSSQATGSNYLKSAALAPTTSVAACGWIKINSWNKNPYSNAIDFGYGTATPTRGALFYQQDWDGTAGGTAHIMQFGWYDEPSGLSGSSGTIVTDSSWIFVFIYLSGTSLTVWYGTETGALSSYTATLAFAAASVTDVRLGSDRFDSGTPADASSRGWRIWTDTAFDATKATSERNSSTFAPVETSGLVTDVRIASGTNPEIATTGSNWTRTGTFADDASNPALGGASDEPLARAATAVEFPVVAHSLRRLVNVAAFVTAAGPADQPPRARSLPLRESPIEEPRIRRLQRLPESVDQPTFLLWSGFDDDTGAPDEPVQRSRRFPLPPPAPVADAAPNTRERVAAEPLAEEPRIRLRRTFPESVAVIADAPPPPRHGLAAEPLPEEPRIRQLRRAPESVDLPVLGTWEIVDSDPPEEARIRRAPRLPDPPVAAVDQPPAPRWRVTSDTPPEDIRNARPRWVLESGAAPATGQPLSRWRTLFEATIEEGRIRVLRRLPESVDVPPASRRRSAAAETVEEPRIRRPKVAPDSVDLPSPELRWEPAYEATNEPRIKRPRIAPESVDAPPAELRRGPVFEPTEEQRVPRPRLVFAPVATVDSPPLVRWRNVYDTAPEDLAIRPLRRLPESYVPPPVDDPPQVRWRTISDTPAEDLPIRRYRLLLESGEPPAVFVPAGRGGTVFFRTSKQTVTFRGR